MLFTTVDENSKSGIWEIHSFEPVLLFCVLQPEQADTSSMASELTQMAASIPAASVLPQTVTYALSSLKQNTFINTMLFWLP